MDFSLDLETLGRHSGCTILSVGLVAFNPKQNLRHAQRMVNGYWELDIEGQLRDGAHVDANTLRWWMKQDDRSVFDASDQVRHGIGDFLDLFREFVETHGTEESKVWAIGQDFDIGMMRSLYHHYDLPWPFKYNAGRDIRTLCDVAEGFGYDRDSYHNGLPAHNALNDAIYGAGLVQHAYAAIHPQ